jgi:hypothetical protein
MTQQEFERRLYVAVNKAYNLVQGTAPVRRGDLKRSIKLVSTASGYDILITAPHMVYTEEPWVSPKWKGRENPNEGWFKEVTELVFRLLRAELRATGKFVGGD